MFPECCKTFLNIDRAKLNKPGFFLFFCFFRHFTQLLPPDYVRITLEVYENKTIIVVSIILLLLFLFHHCILINYFIDYTVLLFLMSIVHKIQIYQFALYKVANFPYINGSFASSHHHKHDDILIVRPSSFPLIFPIS